MKVLTERLRALEKEGIVRRREKPGYPREVWYSLSARARRWVALVDLCVSENLLPDVVEMVLRCRWTGEILVALGRGELRPVELLGRLDGVSKRKLFERLRWLEERALVARHVLDSRPPGAAYGLTPAGRKLARFLGARPELAGSFASLGARSA
ncbi:MAG: hypothetical protein KatS3mg076_2997 [Candidatus Binatia bacterium]|nr:MAG: hypothetical protein KatS3mg076_2997 [Candidatus Binatia bacterium]